VLVKGDGARREGEKGDERGRWAKLNGGFACGASFRQLRP